MNDNLMNRVDSLLKNVEERKNKVVVGSRTVSFIYILLAVFVVFYSSILFIQIKEAVKNDSVSAVLKNMASAKLSDVPALLDDMVDNHAEDLASNMVAAIYDQVPTLETMAKDAISEHSSAIISQIRRDLFPQFHEIIRQNEEDIRVAAEALSDENTAKELAKIIVKKISEEIDYSHGLITTEAESTINEITTHFAAILNKPSDELTSKEASQKRLIVNWLYLVDMEQGIDKIFRTMVQRTGHFWEYYMEELGITDAMQENLTPDLSGAD